MRTNLSRIIAKSSLALVSALLLAACGEKAATPASSTTAPAASSAAAPAAEEPILNLYTARHYEGDDLLFDAFKKQTGIEIKVTSAGADQIISRLKGEGDESPADLLITVDAGRLCRAKDLGLLQPVDSPILNSAIPAALRDPAGHWFGFTVRARIIAYSKERVQPGDITSYADLADPKWKGRLLIRSGESVYNQGLTAAMVANEGIEKTTAWVNGLTTNLARKPLGGDRDQVLAIAQNLGDLALVNSYYLGQMANSKDPAERDAFSKVGLIFPDQLGRGTHINISGAGLAKHAKHPGNARKFLEYLASPAAQQIFPATSYEYPVDPKNDPSPLHKEWGPYKADPLNLAKLGENYKAALAIIEASGW
jgi:iron(III) transport system substrate-binding protein